MSRLVVTRRVFAISGAAGLLVSRGASAAPDATRIRVAFVGDSMADGLWGAFVRSIPKDKCLKDRADGGRYARNGTGLTRSDSYDWPLQARKIVESYAPGAVVASIGLNDRQDVVEPGGGRAVYGTPAWETAYKARIAALLNAAASEGAAVLLVGLPAMRDGTVNTDAEMKNRLFREAVATAGKPTLVFAEAWHPANAAPGTFTSAAPNPAGSGLVQVRAPDGIHFTAGGYDIVWSYLFPKLVANLRNAGRDLGSDCPA